MLFELGPAIVIVLRLVLPLLMFKWRVSGMLAGMLVDGFDTVIISIIGAGTFENYTIADKLLDTYLLTIFLYFSLRWESRIAKITSIVLFSHRLTGVLILVVGDDRSLLFLFPNLFEFFFIYQLITMKWWPHLQIDGYRRLATVLPILLIVKLAQEYVIHVSEFHAMCSTYTDTIEFTSPYLWTGFKEFADGYLQQWC